MTEILPVDMEKAGSYFEGASCVFGVFDGFHLGHQFLVDRALATRQDGKPVLAITFDIDPDEMFAANRLRKLLSNEERLEVLAGSGVDAVAVLPFSREFASLSPVDFLEALFGQGAPAALHVGVDFGFGCKGSGHVEDLRSWGESRGMTVYGHDLFILDGAPVTASRIRGLLSEGRVSAANNLLGRPYSLSGTVVHGRGEGAVFGFPTANLEVDPVRLCVADGVYGCQCVIDNVRYNAAVCIGVPPTFAEIAKQQVEVHVIDFRGDLYDRNLTLDFLQFIRSNRVFSGLDELVATLKDNVATIRLTQPLE